MARYVILYFEDNDEAEAFISEPEPTRYGAYEIKALVPTPTLFCACGVARKSSTGFFKGKKYGWWVCSKCGKPTEAWGTHYAAVIGAGTNLLNEEQVQPPAGYNQGV